MINESLFLGRVALEAQRPIVVKLSREDLSVGPSVCLLVQCIVEKTADRTRMPFGIVGRTGPGMRQVVEFGDRSTGRGAPLYPMGTLRRTCATVSQPSELRFGVVFGGPRHCCIRWGLRRARGRVEVLGFFCSPFS